VKVTRLDHVQPRPRRVAVGEFDGVHLGHRQVIRDADTVLTFEPHPLQVIRPEAAPKLLTALERKIELLEGLGVSELVLIEFDRAFAQRSAQEFIDGVLVGALGASHVSVGENFRFGHKASGDAALLARQDAFETRVTPLVEVDREIVSSTVIRHLIQLGDVERAGRLLGDRFRLGGTVVAGDKRGRTLGYPTANLVPDEALVYPGHGVYAAYANDVPAAVSVGVRPTFGTGRGVLVEAFLIDFDGDLYGTELRLDFVSRLRGERAFATVDALVEQMGEDVAAAATVTRRS
jgi:riboflavin kinase / FMN adenylyltransferase